MTSIEDVAELAEEAGVWRFTSDYSSTAGRVTIQLWGSDCSEITRVVRYTERRGSTKLRIPTSVKWMTVTGYMFNPWGTWLPLPDSYHQTIHWTLTR
ncbi:MAG: hypothetical protein M3319_16415 [Actinomycetota bacterium]|nr:hypothetical protein [Actinomycetota bacterium]